MHKKNENNETNIPLDDIECWERYPKYKWMYDVSRLLDTQHITWELFPSDTHPIAIYNLTLLSGDDVIHKLGQIYVGKLHGHQIINEVYIIKGDIKLIRHINPITKKELDLSVGELELRLSAFVVMYFQKFTGVVSIETRGNNIFKIQLRPYSELDLTSTADNIKLIKRIYKKTDLHVIGLTDRVLHESLAS